MKSQNSNYVKVIVDGVLADAALAMPGLCFDRDVKTLSRLVDERGLGVLLLDLPHLHSLLTEGLECGRLNLAGPLSRAVSKTTKVPRFASGLWLRIFTKDGDLRNDACVNAIFFLTQLCVVWKALNVPCSDSRTAKAIKEYIHVDKELREPTLLWRAGNPCDFVVRDDISFCDSLDDSVPTELFADHRTQCIKHGASNLILRFQNLCDQFAEAVGVYFPPCYTHEWKSADGGTGALGLSHGPGAISVKRASEKFALPNWPDHLNAAFPYKLMVSVPHGFKEPTKNSDPSRLISVPKTAKSPRLIAAEPAEHQFCQQLTWKFLRTRIASGPLSPFINFRKQELSGEMVLRSSVDKSLATVDLSSASDRLSLWVIERAFRKNPSLLTALYAHRSKYIKLPQGDLMWLRKFASQGAAVTFPGQTIIFCLATLAACGVDNLSLTDKRLRRLIGRVRTFGDDMIVPSENLQDLTVLLEFLQLKVNKTKSFVTGNFRESCGTDAFKGIEITPVKIKDISVMSPDSRRALLDTVNNTFQKGLWRTSEELRKLLPEKMRKHLPVNNLRESPPRIFSFMGSDYRHLSMRWKSDTQVVEYKSFGFKAVEALDRDEIFLSGNLALRAFLNDRQDPMDSNGHRSSAAKTRTRDGTGWGPLPQSPFKAIR